MMNFKDIKKLISIANTLDSKGLWKEADALEKIAGDIINFQERAREIKGDDYFATRKEYDEDAEVLYPSKEDVRDEEGFYKDDKAEIVKEFVEEHLSPSTAYFDYTGEATELGEYLYNRSPELKEYMEEVLPDKIDKLAAKLKVSFRDAFELVKDVSSSLEVIKNDDDFSFILEAMHKFFEDYEMEEGNAY